MSRILYKKIYKILRVTYLRETAQTRIMFSDGGKLKIWYAHLLARLSACCSFLREG